MHEETQDYVRVGKLRHAGVMVNSLVRAKYFYCDLLGFKIVEEKKVEPQYARSLFGRPLDLTYLKLRPAFVCPICAELEGQPHAELCSMGGGKNVYYNGISNEALVELYYIIGRNKEYVNYLFSHHMSFTVQNLMGLRLRLEDAGIKMVGEITKDPLGYHELFFATDFDGNLIEFVEPIRMI